MVNLSHCQAMAKTWQELGLKMKDRQNIVIAEVDCSVETELCLNHDINGYPTLVLYKNGVKLKDYVGARELQSFEQFLNGFIERDEL